MQRSKGSNVSSAVIPLFLSSFLSVKVIDNAVRTNRLLAGPCFSPALIILYYLRLPVCLPSQRERSSLAF